MINDELFILETCLEIVKEMGIHHVDKAQNGLEAYYMILEKYYDLIICDINMPVMNGYEFGQKAVQHYSENKVYEAQNVYKKYPYIVACTSHLTSEVAKKCTEAGFNKSIEFLTVPILKKEILPKVLQQI